jgi:hypothetical protein
MRTHVRANTFAHTGARRHRQRRRARWPAPHRGPDERVRNARGGALPRAGSGAYIGQRGDRRGVPRAYVRVERLRLTERLRAEPNAVTHRRKVLARPGAPARIRVRPNTHTRARAYTHDRIGGRKRGAGTHW